MSVETFDRDLSGSRVFNLRAYHLNLTPLQVARIFTVITSPIPMPENASPTDGAKNVP